MISAQSLRSLFRHAKPSRTIRQNPRRPTVLSPRCHMQLSVFPSTTTPFSTSSSRPARAATSSGRGAINRRGAPTSSSGSFGSGSSSGGKRGKKKGGGRPKRDPKLYHLVMALESPHKIAPPLRMARNRHLRHWTIHRAWQLYQRQQREAREKELMQMYQSMESACEALRLTDGPGRRPMGYLYRVAMEKKGVWRNGAVPIEYARPLTETPARVAWDHAWKRA